MLKINYQILAPYNRIAIFTEKKLNYGKTLLSLCHERPSDRHPVFINDEALKKIAASIAIDKFGEPNLDLLNLKERIDICKTLRRLHGAEVKQMGRLFRIKSTELKNIF